MSSTHQQKISSLELGRVISMVAIVILHSHILLSAPIINGTPWFGYIIDQLMRFAVPFFFILSGYLIAPKLDQSPLSTLKHYSLPLLKIWVIWSIICLLIPFNWEVLVTQGYLSERTGYWEWLLQNPINTLFEGGLVHLWFIPGLVCAIAIIALCIRFKLTHLLPLFAILLYLYGLCGGSYGKITEIWTPFITRNGPFFSTLMVWVGYEIRRRTIKVTLNTAVIMTITGLIIHLSEAAWLTRYEVIFNSHDFLLGTPIWAVGLFMLLLNKPNLGDHPLVYKSANMVLSIYIAHLPILIILYNLAGTYGLEGYSKDITLIVGTIIITLFFTQLLSRTPIKKILLR